jgi:transposase
MRRFGLRDDQWDRIKDILPGREGHVGGTAADNRLFVEAVLFRFRAGIPWRDLPERFPGHRHALRQARQDFPRRRSARQRRHPPQLKTGPSRTRHYAASALRLVGVGESERRSR